MTTSRLSVSAGRKLTGPTPAAIDDDHLRQMTLGDPALEREVLEIFMRQAALMLRRIAGAKPALAAAAAHTLKGSARGIGAWRVAQAADCLERAAAGDDSLEAFKVAIAELEAASREARAAILARYPIVPTTPARTRATAAPTTIEPICALALASPRASR